MLRAIVILSIAEPIEGEKPQHQLLQTQFDLVILMTRQDDVTEYTEHSSYQNSSSISIEQDNFFDKLKQFIAISFILEDNHQKHYSFYWQTSTQLYVLM